MLWALLFAGGVAVVVMTIFAARLTRKPDQVRDESEFAPSIDPSDPWAAWKPRSSFDELDRPRPRLWPLLGSLTGIVLLGAGLAGARQTLWATSAAPTTGMGPVAEVTTRPDIVEVTVTDAPTPPPTPDPTVEPTAEPTLAPAPAPVKAEATTAPVAATAPTGSGPTVSATTSCSAGKLAISYTATAGGSNLSWIAVYADGAVAKGGPISGTSYSGTYSKASTPGDHALEVSVQDKAGRTTRKQFQVHCV
jgi:hypothetical protein